MCANSKGVTGFGNNVINGDCIIIFTYEIIVLQKNELPMLKLNYRALFINRRFALNEMFQRNDSKFAILLCIRKPM